MKACKKNAYSAPQFALKNELRRLRVRTRSWTDLLSSSPRQCETFLHSIAVMKYFRFYCDVLYHYFWNWSSASVNRLRWGISKAHFFLFSFCNYLADWDWSESLCSPHCTTCISVYSHIKKPSEGCLPAQRLCQQKPARYIYLKCHFKKYIAFWRLNMVPRESRWKHFPLCCLTPASAHPRRHQGELECVWIN